LLEKCWGIVDLAGAAGGGEVRAFGSQFGVLKDLANDLAGAMADAQTSGVGGGELEAIEQDGRATLLDEPETESADNFGDGNLDCLTVFQGRELDPTAVGFCRIAGDESPIASMGPMEARVEVAEGIVFKSDSAALEAVRFDVAAEVD
jgi:hypothetical protein